MAVSFIRTLDPFVLKVRVALFIKILLFVYFVLLIMGARLQNVTQKLEKVNISLDILTWLGGNDQRRVGGPSQWNCSIQCGRHSLCHSLHRPLGP